MANRIPAQLRGWILPLVIATVILAPFPVIDVPRAWLLYLFLFFIYLALANMWNLLAGYCGLISLAQPAFIGLAGYILAIMAWVGLPLYLGVICGGITAAIFALVISRPLFRLRGVYFIVASLIVPEALRIVFFLWRPVGGVLYGKGAGYVIKGSASVPPMETYWMALVIGMGTAFLMYFILRSRLGLGLAAIRDNDNTAASSGINVYRLKVYSFTLSALITGIAGAGFYISQGFIEPISAFNIQWTMILMLATVIGGIGIMEGPILGAIIVVFLHFLLARYAGISLLIQGVILIFIMLVAPQGIMGSIRRIRVYQTYRGLLKLATRK